MQGTSKPQDRNEAPERIANSKSAQIKVNEGIIRGPQATGAGLAY
jgi:hypothetical protein